MCSEIMNTLYLCNIAKFQVYNALDVLKYVAVFLNSTYRTA
jgi:hypothetical protein